MCINKNDIEEIKYIYNNLLRNKEGNVQNLVVFKMLEKLGYDSIKFDTQHPIYHRDGYADIAVKIDNDTYLYVEVKAGDVELKEPEVMQLVRYLNDKSLEWGILTNGREYVLINNYIKTLSAPSVGAQTTLDDKIVLKINIFDNRYGNIDYLHYLCRKHIFSTKITYYFKNIAQYRADKHPKLRKKSTWDQYRSTLFNFFKFYSEQEGKYRPLEQIRTDDFQAYLKQDSGFNTQNNKWTHIRTFFNVLGVNGDFDKPRNKLVNPSVKTENIPVEEKLNKENVTKILSFISKTEDSLRNRVLFLLTLYMGAELPLLQNLNEDMFNFNQNILKLDNKKIPLLTQLAKSIEELFKQNKKDKIRNNNLFNYYYEGKYSLIDEQNTAYLFGEIRKRHPELKGVSLRSIRTALIKMLFFSNYSIEEISYLTSMSLQGISKLITNEDIIKKVSLTRKKPIERKHPFHEFLL